MATTVSYHPGAGTRASCVKPKWVPFVLCPLLSWGGPCRASQFEREHRIQQQMTSLPPSRVQSTPQLTLPPPSSTPPHFSSAPTLKSHNAGQWQHSPLPASQHSPLGTEAQDQHCVRANTARPALGLKSLAASLQLPVLAVWAYHQHSSWIGRALIQQIPQAFSIWHPTGKYHFLNIVQYYALFKPKNFGLNCFDVFCFFLILLDRIWVPKPSTIRLEKKTYWHSSTRLLQISVIT